jgi:hypothetical protein
MAVGMRMALVHAGFTLTAYGSGILRPVHFEATQLTRRNTARGFSAGPSFTPERGDRCLHRVISCRGRPDIWRPLYPECCRGTEADARRICGRVRFGSLAAANVLTSGVRFAPESGHWVAAQ